MGDEAQIGSAGRHKQRVERVSETTFRDAIIDVLNMQPGVWVHCNTLVRVKGRGVVGLGKGSPDIVGHVRCFWQTQSEPFGTGARFFALETKRPGAPASEHAERRAEQEAWAVKHRALGAFVALIAPKFTVQEGIDAALAAVQRCRRGEAQ